MSKQDLIKSIAVILIISLTGCATYVSSECEWAEKMSFKSEVVSLMSDREKMQVDYQNLMIDEVCR